MEEYKETAIILHHIIPRHIIVIDILLFMIIIRITPGGIINLYPDSLKNHILFYLVESFTFYP
jgi:hypothetical protein